MNVSLTKVQYKYLTDLLFFEKLALEEFKNKSFSHGRDIPDCVQDDLNIVNSLLSNVFFLRFFKSTP